MKYCVLLILMASSLYAQDTSYFRVYAELKEDAVFTRILQEANLEDMFTDKFQIVVNIGGTDSFVVIGEYTSKDVEWDRNAYRYDWLFFSPAVRGKLLKCKNKIVLH